MEYFTLNNGIQMPAAGIGVFMMSPAEAEASVESALRSGVRLIDTANGYMNESGNVVIPGSKNPDHIRDNFDIFDFALTDNEMAEIAKIDKGMRYYTATPELIAQYAKMELQPDL